MVISLLRRAYSNFVAKVYDVPARLLAFLSLLILILLPITNISGYYLRIFITANILGIFAASWDLLVGRTGQISLGHAIFYGIGGYSSALLFKYFGLPIWVTIPLAVLIGTLSALIVGYPCLRVKGPYLALVTMVIPLIAENVVSWGGLSEITGGDTGIRNIPTFFPSMDPYQRTIGEYFLTLSLLFMSAVILHKIANSKTGIVFVSILDDEIASKACGINVTKQKLIAVMISGCFASLSGSVFAHLHPPAATPVEMFSIIQSLLPLIVTFLGGIGTIYGPIVGSYIYVILDRLVMPRFLPPLLRFLKIPIGGSSELDALILLIFAAVILIMVIAWPRGIARTITDKLEDLEEPRDLDERGPRIWKKYKKKDKQEPANHGVEHAPA